MAKPKTKTKKSVLSSDAYFKTSVLGSDAYFIEQTIARLQEAATYQLQYIDDPSDHVRGVSASEALQLAQDMEVSLATLILLHKSLASIWEAGHG